MCFVVVVDQRVKVNNKIFDHMSVDMTLSYTIFTLIVISAVVECHSAIIKLLVAHRHGTMLFYGCTQKVCHIIKIVASIVQI